MKKLALALAVSGAFVAGSANALFIDNFNTGYSFLSITPPTPAPQTTTVAATALGGSRTTTISTATGNGPSLVVDDSTVVPSGTLQIGNPPSQGSTGSVTWGGALDADLTDVDQNDAIQLNIIKTDVNNVDLTFTITDTSDNVATLTLPNLVIGPQAFLFAAFTNYAGTDFHHVKEVVLSYVTPADTDTEIDLVRTRFGTNVPLPGTLALFGAGLIGLGLRGRKKAA